MKKTVKRTAPEDKTSTTGDSTSADIDFQQMFADVIPLRTEARIIPSPQPRKPVVTRSSEAQSRDSRFIPADMLSEADEAPTFVRAGQNNQVLRKLKRGFWPIAAELDLHGNTREQAQRLLSDMLTQMTGLGVCLRIIHGRALGAPQGPVLKRLTRAWLRQQDEVLAFCEAPLAQGGEGALLVLLKNRKKRNPNHDRRTNHP